MLSEMKRKSVKEKKNGRENEWNNLHFMIYTTTY